MNRRLPLAALLAAFAVASTLHAQAPAAPAGTAAPAAAPAAAAEPSKACLTARKKEDKEQRSLNAAIESLAHDRKARESCSSKSMCARYDSAIAATEKRQARHETRLARFREDVASACKT